ncbi:MAG: cation-translocating P-type ATPase [Planctomycetaceae bacterium]
MSAFHSPAACDYCGLPMPAPLWGGDASTNGPHYCCYGCQFAHSATSASGETGANRWTLTRLGIAVFFTMNVMVFSIALWAYDTSPVGPLETGDVMAGSFVGLLKAACMLASVPVLILLGVPIAENALRTLRSGILSTDLLLMTGVIVAYGFSVSSVLFDSGGLYFEVACMILVMVTLGRWLEATGKLKSTEALDRLQQLLPSEVRQVDPTGTERLIPLADVRVGDALRIHSGERIPADGLLHSGRATVDEQLLTGESWPVEKTHGDPLTGGTLNLEGDAILRVTVPPNEGTLHRLVAAVRESRLRQGAYQNLADRIARCFFPIVGLIATATLIGHGLSSGWGTGLLNALAVVLIACPCALGIATPMAVWAAIGSAARRGIVIGSGETLEKLAAIKAVRIDKTGTITTGQPTIQRIIVDDETDRGEFLTIAATLAETSNHPFSRAIAATCVERVSLDAWSSISAIAGRGIVGTRHDESHPVVLGNESLMNDLDLEIPTSMADGIADAQTQGQPFSLIGWGGRVQGMFAFEEVTRPGVTDLLEFARHAGLDVGVLTGDHRQRGERLARELGVSVMAELSPEAKVNQVLQTRQKYGPVAMIGDGVNDVVAIAEADVGIALGCGADVTRESAEVCLISNDLAQLPWLFGLSQRAVTTIRRNLFWAFAYNGVGVIVASAGYLHPSLAAALMVGSSLYVITNSLRLSTEESSAVRQVVTVSHPAGSSHQSIASRQPEGTTIR